jgi:hypothetical protein
VVLAVLLMIGACRDEPPSSPPPAPVASAPSGEVTASTPSEYPERLAPASATATEPDRAEISTASAATAAVVAPPPSPRFLPLADAKVGEWGRYRMRDEQDEELRVVKVESGVVSIELKMSWHGKPLGLPAIRRERADEDRIAAHAERVGAQVAVTEASVEAAGMLWPCRLITETWTDEGIHYIRRIWYHSEAPIHGIVKMDTTADAKPAAFMELIDYGPRQATSR